MTLSYLSFKSMPRIRPAPRSLPKPTPMFRSVQLELAAAYAEVSSSPLFGSVLLRVGSALFVAFWLVHFAKAFIS